MFSSGPVIAAEKENKIIVDKIYRSNIVCEGKSRDWWIGFHHS